MQVEKLEGSLLNYWVAKAADMGPTLKTYGGGYQVCQVAAPMPLIGNYIFDASGNWAHAGPIIEKNQLTVVKGNLTETLRYFVRTRYGTEVSDDLPV